MGNSKSLTKQQAVKTTKDKTQKQLNPNKPKNTQSIASKQSKTLKEINFKIHIAIDFGTDGCALAFAYNNKVTVYNKWNTKKRQRRVKAKTQILLNEKNEIVAFGDNAKIIYSGLTGDEKK
eukprot:198300_1